jgi:cytochrome c oxidase subunit 2
MKAQRGPGGKRPRAGWREWLARGVALALLIGIPLATALSAPKSGPANGQAIEIHARIPEQGGWSVTRLTARAGQPMRLRLVSDDVVHGFQIGKSEQAAIELPPGKSVETWVRLDQPGEYTFYCTRWCGPNHWRMRGTIEVLPAAGAPSPRAAKETPPLYVSLGVDIDAPHPAQATPQGKPSARRGARLGFEPGADTLTQDFYHRHSPAQAWEILRGDPATQGLDDGQMWDLVALIWADQTSREGLERGKDLYAENCAACHGEQGAGDGVYAAGMAAQAASGMEGHGLQRPADFTDPASLLGASPAVLYGKIARGGMGTGMPYWGPIFTEEQTWELVAAVYAFQFDLEVER